RFRSIQIDDMDIFCSFCFPLLGHVDRGIAIHLFSIIVALNKADTLTIQNIYCWKNNHTDLLCISNIYNSPFVEGIPFTRGFKLLAASSALANALNIASII